MNATLRKAYTELRTKYGMRASEALNGAKHSIAARPIFTTALWSDEWSEVELGNGYTIRARLASDDDHRAPWAEYDCFGAPESVRSIDHFEPGNGYVELASGDRGHVWRYPLADALRRYTAELRKYDPKRGRAQLAADALAGIKSESDRFGRWLRDDWSYVGVVVELLRDGETVDESSLWGIESDCDEYLLETANELARELISNSAMRFRRAATLETA